LRIWWLEIVECLTCGRIDKFCNVLNSTDTPRKALANRRQGNILDLIHDTCAIYIESGVLNLLLPPQAPVLSPSLEDARGGWDGQQVVEIRGLTVNVGRDLCKGANRRDAAVSVEVKVDLSGERDGNWNDGVDTHYEMVS
jgi:hypothetical protein